MSSSSDHTNRTRRPRLNAAGKALLWIAVIVLAISPWPWW